MDEVEQLIRTIFILHGRTYKIPLEEEEQVCYDYEEDYIIQKLLYRHELREHIIKKEGYPQEQAEKIISESVLRGIIDLKSIDSRTKSRDNDEYAMANEEYWAEEELHRLRDRVVEDFMRSEVKNYVLEFQFGLNDEDEERLREVYAEHNKKELSKQQLMNGLIKRGYTEKQAEELLEKYTTIGIEEEEKKGWDEAEKLFRRPEYKPLKHYENKRIVKRKNGDIIVMDIPDCYEIMQIEEWKLKEYNDIGYLRRSRDYIYGTKKVPFKTIRKIFREAEKQGKKTLTRSQLTQKILEECNTTEEETKTAIHGAELTFKIRTMNPTLRKVWNLEPFRGEVEYYWSGTTSGYPPFTLQDRVFNPIKKALREAEKMGKEALTREELVQKAYELYQEYKKSYKSIPLRLIERGFIELRIEDAEELLLITALRENDEIKYKLNHQILKQPKNQDM